MEEKKLRPLSVMARYVGLSLLSKGLSVSPLKLQKILYYAQSWYMVFFGRRNTLFAEAPQAWVNGPVYPSVYHEYKSKTAGMCDHLTLSDFGVDNEEHAEATLSELSKVLDFTPDEIELLDSIITLYGAKTQNELIFMTHSEQPWAEKRMGLAPFQRSETDLSLDTMHDYYLARHQRNRERRAKNEA